MQQSAGPMSVEQWTEQIKQDVGSHEIIVYAKGEKNAAMCGFSHRVMQVFNHLDVPYEVRNIFADPNIRPALCAYSDWPTTPQVFISGKFIGGCDIVMEMFQNGELKKLVESASPPGS